jgi:hypothetical protein
MSRPEPKNASSVDRKPSRLDGGKATYRIELFAGEACYLARFSDPSIVEAFGQDTLPTAFTAEATPGDVLAHVAAKYPGSKVVLVEGPARQRS